MFDLHNLNFFIFDINFDNRVTFIKDRIQRPRVLNYNRSLKVTSGDILSVVFWQEGAIYKFEGICLAVRKKNLLNLNASLVLRNVIFGIGIEFTISYYINRAYFLTILDYKRKEFNYRRSKLYYLRYKLNRASRVK